ncbi:MAG: hypothetical protein ABW221_15575 [Vicinamibacteria bacterium]
MRSRCIPTAAGLLLAAALFTTPARADEWDNAADPDNGISTDNTLFHGSTQVHDLATQVGPVADQDWFLVGLRPFSSYEVVVDGTTGDLGLGTPHVQRMDVNGNAAQNAIIEAPAVLALKWRTGAGSSSVANYVRVSGAACHPLCDLADRYRIRFYDTTCTVPRFNNSGSQTTALVLQTTRRGCEISIAFFRTDGSLITTHATTLASQSAVVLPAASIAGVAGQSGSIRILHDCGYGGLSGKAVSIEPSTGFTFDTAIVPRPH